MNFEKIKTINIYFLIILFFVIALLSFTALFNQGEDKLDKNLNYELENFTNCSLSKFDTNKLALDNQIEIKYNFIDISIFPEVSNLYCIGKVSQVVYIEEDNSLLATLITSMRAYRIISLSLSLMVLVLFLINRYKHYIFFCSVTILNLLLLILFQSFNNPLESILLSILKSIPFIFIYTFYYLAIFQNKKNNSFYPQTKLEKLDFSYSLNFLRALAVVAVILYHFEYQLFKHGYLGVDIFFVISGFLIGYGLLYNIQEELFSISDFYSKRIKRILPSLLSVVIFTITIFYFVSYPFQLEEIAKTVLWKSFFVVNEYFSITIDYFSQLNSLNPFIHLWSISVEEQFYIIFPIIVIFLSRKYKNIGKFLLAIFFISLVAFSLPNSSYYSILTRGWQILLGVLIVIFAPKYLTNSIHPRYIKLLKVFNTVFILFLLVDFRLEFINLNITDNFRAISISISTAIVILLRNEYKTIRNILSIPINQIGLMSYSLYLFHQPILAFFRMPLNNFELNDIQILFLVIFVSFLNYKFIENKFRYSKLLKKNLFIFLVLYVGTLSIFSFYLISTNGFEERYVNTLNQESRSVYDNLKEINDLNIDTEKIQFQDDKCKFWNETINNEVIEKFNDCKLENNALLIIGDSHAMDLYNMAFLNSDHPFIVGISSPGCRVHSYKPGCSYEDLQEFVKLNQDYIDLVYYNQAGFYLIENNGSSIIRTDFQNENIESFSVFTERVKKIYDYLQKFPSSVETKYVGSWIEPHIHPNTISIANYEKANDLNPKIISLFYNLDKTASSMSNDYSAIEYISTLNFYHLNSQNYIFNIEKNEIYFSDLDHFSRQGEFFYGNIFFINN